MHDGDLRQNDATWRIWMGTGQTSHEASSVLLCDLCPAYPAHQRQMRNTFIWACDDCLPIVSRYLALRNAARCLPNVHA